MRINFRLIIPAFALLACAVFSPASAKDYPLFIHYPQINTKRWYISDGWSNGKEMSCQWSAEAISAKNRNLFLTLSDKPGKLRNYSCPEIHTKRTSSYGTYAARLRAATGSGLNTAFFTYVGPGTDSPAHDEIDFEFLGKDSHSVQLNYYINGKSQGEVLIKLAYDASKEFHDYSFVWEPTRISWFIDGKQVHETKKDVAIPTHPGRIYLSLWSGSKEVDKWLGKFEYKQPATAEFSWVKFTPLSP